MEFATNKSRLTLLVLGVEAMRTSSMPSKLIFGIVGMVALLVGTSAYALTLPSVTSCGYAPPYDNLMCYTAPETGGRLYVGSTHDDFLSYSSNNLSMYANIKDANGNYVYTSLSEWRNTPSFGSGQIVKIFSFNSSNNGGFPDPTIGTNDNKSAPDADLTAKGDNNYQGEWPVGTTVTVGQLKAFLGTGANTPVFTFDLNELAPGLDLNGYLRVTTATGTKTFAFDNTFNHAYDQESLVHALRTQTVVWYDPIVCPAATGFICSVDVDNDVGSGKPDYFTYALGFNLYNYADSDTLYFFMNMVNIDSGGEELAITNMVIPGTQVPEPASLALLGLSILGLSMVGRKKISA
jgi:hypothetical protein